MTAFDSALVFTAPGTVSGYVLDRHDTAIRWAVGLFHNDNLVDITIADRFDAALRQGDGCYAFAFPLTALRLAKSDRLDIRVLNTAYSLGPVPFDTEAAPFGGTGTVQYVRGLSLRGTMTDSVTPDSSYRILAFHEDRIVGQARLDRWQHVEAPASRKARHLAFDLVLDASLADGQFKRIRVETSTGIPLAGSPLDIVAYPDRFRSALLDQLPPGHADLARYALDRLIDNSAPFSAYAALYPALTAPLLGAGDAILFGDTGAYIAVPDTDAVLVFHRQMHLRADWPSLLPNTAFDLCYPDFALRPGDDVLPILLPAFDLERLGEQAYCTYAFFVRRDLFDAALLAEPASPFALFLHILAAKTDAIILHLPQPIGVLGQLDHTSETALMLDAAADNAGLWGGAPKWRKGRGSTFPALRLDRDPGQSATTLIIPTRDNPALLRECVETLFEHNADESIELIIVDNNSTDPEALALLDRFEADGAKVLEYKSGFNYAQMNNLAVEHASNDTICLLNNDVAFFRPGALRELRARLSDPSIGVVGPLMARASDIIQHGGVVLGPHHGAGHAFEDRMLGDPGYADLLRVAHECSAVTGAMLMTRKSLFERLGGFDEIAFPINFNDVDYCLRVREVGRRVVFTPHAVIRHHESASRGLDIHSPGRHRLEREILTLRDRWHGVIHNDPFFHPLFSLDTLPYRALSTINRAPAARSNTISPNAIFPAGF